MEDRLKKKPMKERKSKIEKRESVAIFIRVLFNFETNRV